MIIYQVPRGVATDFPFVLVDANSDDWKANPTLASGDFKITKDYGAFANLATLPTVEPAAGRQIKIPFSASELTATAILLQAVDQTSPKEWKDTGFLIITARVPYVLGTINDSTPSTTINTLSAEFQATADAYVEMAIVGLSGANIGLSRKITAYTSGRVCTHDAFPTTFADGDSVMVIGIVK